MKKLAPTLILLAGLALSGCAQPGEKANPQPPQEDTPPVVSTADTPDYFFIDDLLVGGYSDDGWRSVQAVAEVSAYEEDAETASASVFTAAEIAGVKSYQLYAIDEFIGSTTEIIWSLDSSGLGTFGQDGQFTPEMRDALQALALPVTDPAANAPYDDLGRIALPADFTDSPLSALTMPQYNAYSYFSLNDTLDIRNSSIRLATSAEHNPLPHKVQVLYQLPKALEAAIGDELAQLGIPDAPVNLTDYYATDFDHDGRDESLIIVQTAKGKNGYPQFTEDEAAGASGVYTLVLYLDDEKADPVQTLQPLFSWVNAYTPELLTEALAQQAHLNEAAAEIMDADYSRQLTFLGAFDLNGDGALEFCLQDGQWEGGAIRVYALDENDRYHTVMVSRQGM